jgi:UDP-arabinose 4-epimerase
MHLGKFAGGGAMNQPNILVTGGAGFIGSHTCKQLALNGFTPVTYDDLSTGNLDAVKFGPFVLGDLQESNILSAAFEKYQPEAVIHFAAFAYVGESIDHPARYYENNVSGTLALLRACREHDVKRIVFSSSCATYGIPDALPITEYTPQHPINPYGESKLIVEHILKDFSNAYGLQTAVLRYFNACGADLDGELSEQHDPETHLIPRALMAAAGKIKDLTIYGQNYKTPDGTCIRDYIHVQDLAEAHVLALRYLLQSDENLIVNLGSGKGISVLEIIEAVQTFTGKTIPVIKAKRRPGDPSILYADPTLARNKLGFETAYSNLGQIIATAAPSFGLEVMQ